MKAIPNISKEYKYVNLLLFLVLIVFLLYPTAVSLPDLQNSYLPIHLPAPKSMMHQFPNAPCSSCGLTRSIVSLYHGNLSASLNYNPVGVVIVVLGFVQVIFRVIIAFSRNGFLPWLDLIQLFVCGLFIRILLILNLNMN
jgi:hypothetical protein